MTHPGLSWSYREFAHCVKKRTSRNHSFCIAQAQNRIARWLCDSVYYSMGHYNDGWHENASKIVEELQAVTLQESS